MNIFSIWYTFSEVIFYTYSLIFSLISSILEDYSLKLKVKRVTWKVGSGKNMNSPIYISISALSILHTNSSKLAVTFSPINILVFASLLNTVIYPGWILTKGLRLSMRFFLSDCLKLSIYRYFRYKVLLKVMWSD